jgi:hypothetical protein
MIVNRHRNNSHALTDYLVYNIRDRYILAIHKAERIEKSLKNVGKTEGIGVSKS